jgi:hypothetical protein
MLLLLSLEFNLLLKLNKFLILKLQLSNLLLLPNQYQLLKL